MFKSHSAQFLITHRKPLAYALVAAFVVMVLGDIETQMGLSAASSVGVLLLAAAVGGYRLGRSQTSDRKKPDPKTRKESDG